jgi:hypothetical protein
MDDELWIQEQRKLLNIKINYKREPLEYINLQFCYVDSNNSIVNLKTEKHTFSDLSENQLISESYLLNIIETKKHDANINYVFSELSLFLVDLEPENIQSIVPTTPQFFKSFPFITDISIAKSIFIFHPFNCLFFLFTRRKSSLKKNSTKTTKSTKKVGFSLPPSNKHTRRII